MGQFDSLLSFCRSLSCTSGSRSRLSQSVTVEEDNCCGCNVLAIRRQFLDRDLKQVQIVYTSCHDAVREPKYPSANMPHHTVFTHICSVYVDILYRLLV